MSRDARRLAASPAFVMFPGAHERSIDLFLDAKGVRLLRPPELVRNVRENPGAQRSRPDWATTQGYPIGDEVLKVLADALRAAPGRCDAPPRP